MMCISDVQKDPHIHVSRKVESGCSLLWDSHVSLEISTHVDGVCTCTSGEWWSGSSLLQGEIKE